MIFPLASWWRYDYKGLLTYRCLQYGTLKKHEKFEADWTMYIRVISELQPLPGSWRKHQNSERRHGHGHRRKLKLLTTFHLKGLKMTPTKFEVGLINFLGGVR